MQVPHLKQSLHALASPPQPVPPMQLDPIPHEQ
jgi:hypothetical protein